MGKTGKPKHKKKLEAWVCTHCIKGDCNSCIDVGRVLMSPLPVSEFVPICKCKRPGHDGEPVNQQIRDPFDGSVHAPGLVITEDGEVKRHASPPES